MGSPQVYACVQVLAAFLLFELSKGPASFWFPYLDSLPHTFTSLSWFHHRRQSSSRCNHT